MNIDLVFSYWIFAWFILYQLKIVKYNPQFALLCGLIENLFILSLMIYYKNSLLFIVSFIFINFFLKILPLWLLRKTRFSIKDIFATIILFLIYILWLKFNKINVKKFFKDIFKNIKNNRPCTPFISFVNKFF
jgi:hypothetical protein